MSESYEVPASITPRIPRAFIERRLQSFAGFFLVLFLTQHLFINSQSALFFGDDPGSFLRLVNYLRSIPYLPVVEIILLGVPFAIHTWWGIHRLYTSAPNSFPTDGSIPHLEYPRNRAYTWQRITSIILVIGVVWHVASMRFISAPKEVQGDVYYVKLTMDPGLESVADRLHVRLEITDNEVIGVTENVAAAILLMIRDTFKSPLMCVLYSLFVMAAVFHTTNGLWTFCITWGITLTERSRIYLRYFSHGLLVLLLFFGLASIWGTYWVTLRS